MDNRFSGRLLLHYGFLFLLQPRLFVFVYVCDSAAKAHRAVRPGTPRSFQNILLCSMDFHPLTFYTASSVGTNQK